MHFRQHWQPYPTTGKPYRAEYDLTLSQDSSIGPGPTFYRNYFLSPFLSLLLSYIITLAHTLDSHYKTLQAPRLAGDS